MEHLPKRITENGIDYILVGDYYISVIAVLSSIKDEKVKELLLNQIKLAAQMNF